MPLLSIIVPIYNGEAYVEGLLNDFARQTVKDFELIVVDDGSTDGTYRELDKRAASQPYPIRIERIAPSGVSAARNRGLALARGTYVSFVAADDHIVPNYVEFLRKVSARADFELFVFQSKRTGPDGPFNKKARLHYRRTNAPTMLHSLAVNPTQYGVYNLFIARKYLNSRGFRFAEKFDYYEDYDFLFRLFAAVDRIRISKSELYYYVLRKGSAVASYQVKRFEDMTLINDLLVPYLQQIRPQFAGEYVNLFLPRIWWSLLWQSCLAFSHKDWKEFVELSEVRDRLEPLKRHPNWKVRLSTVLFLQHPGMFFYLVRLLGRSRSRVTKTDLEPFAEYFLVKREEAAAPWKY